MCVRVLLRASVVLQHDAVRSVSRVVLVKTLQALVGSVVKENRTIPGAILHVEAPCLGLSWSHAAGVVDRQSGTPLTPQHPVRLASNTKTFVAAAILRLCEEGRLALDAALVDYLPSDLLQMLTRDGYQPEAITIRHLLTHTSGLFDYADSPAFGRKVSADPTHRWTRAEQLQEAMDEGEPYGSPGQVYRYSDTGYILLGEIIERTSGQPLATALRELLDYAHLGLASTWLETLEPQPAGAKERVHQYIGDDDTYGMDPSFDLYGGGGLVSTVGDLARFIRGVFTGGVYKCPATGETMLTTIMAERGGPAAYDQEQVAGVYRMGVTVVEIDGVTVYMHDGFWGTRAAYVPSLDVAISATVTQHQGRPALAEMFQQALMLVRAASKPGKRRAEPPAQGK